MLASIGSDNMNFKCTECGSDKSFSTPGVGDICFKCGKQYPVVETDAEYLTRRLRELEEEIVQPMRPRA